MHTHRDVHEIRLDEVAVQRVAVALANLPPAPHLDKHNPQPPHTRIAHGLSITAAHDARGQALKVESLARKSHVFQNGRNDSRSAPLRFVSSLVSNTSLSISSAVSNRT